MAIELPFPGKYKVSNAPQLPPLWLLGNLAMCSWFGGRILDMRMGLIPWLGGGLVINDAYNANPTSMAAALHTAKEIGAAGGWCWCWETCLSWEIYPGCP